MVDVLPAKTVTVLFLNCTNHHYAILIIKKSKILHDLCSIYCRNCSTKLIGNTTTTDFFLVLKSLIRIKVPVISVSDTYCIDMSVKCDESLSASHESHNITLWIHLNLVKAYLFHLSLDSSNVSSLIR